MKLLTTIVALLVALPALGISPMYYAPRTATYEQFRTGYNRNFFTLYDSVFALEYAAGSSNHVVNSVTAGSVRVLSGDGIVIGDTTTRVSSVGFYAFEFPGYLDFEDGSLVFRRYAADEVTYGVGGIHYSVASPGVLTNVTVRGNTNSFPDIDWASLGGWSYDWLVPFTNAASVWIGNEPTEATGYLWFYNTDGNGWRSISHDDRGWLLGDYPVMDHSGNVPAARISDAISGMGLNAETSTLNNVLSRGASSGIPVTLDDITATGGVRVSGGLQLTTKVVLDTDFATLPSGFSIAPGAGVHSPTLGLVLTNRGPYITFSNDTALGAGTLTVTGVCGIVIGSSDDVTLAPTYRGVACNVAGVPILLYPIRQPAVVSNFYFSTYLTNAWDALSFYMNGGGPIGSKAISNLYVSFTPDLVDESGGSLLRPKPTLQDVVNNGSSCTSLIYLGYGSGFYANINEGILYGDGWAGWQRPTSYAIQLGHYSQALGNSVLLGGEVFTDTEGLGIAAGNGGGHRTYASYRGIAVGKGADARGTWWDENEGGQAIGPYSKAFKRASAFGHWGYGDKNSASLGYASWSTNYALAAGPLAAAANLNVALGPWAWAVEGTNRTALGPQTSNSIDNSLLSRGDHYLDGGATVYGRTNFGSGAWVQLTQPLCFGGMHFTGAVSTLTLPNNVYTSVTNFESGGVMAVYRCPASIGLVFTNNYAVYTNSEPTVARIEVAASLVGTLNRTYSICLGKNTTTNAAIESSNEAASSTRPVSIDTFYVAPLVQGDKIYVYIKADDGAENVVLEHCRLVISN